VAQDQVPLAWVTPPPSVEEVFPMNIAFEQLLIWPKEAKRVKEDPVMSWFSQQISW